MKPFNRFPNVDYFTCDACQKKLQWKTAYSVAKDWEEFEVGSPTFCFNCTKVIAKSQVPKLDKRSLNKTGRVHQLATRVRKDFLKKLKKIARKERLKYVEVLEKALDYYGERK